MVTLQLGAREAGIQFRVAAFERVTERISSSTTVVVSQSARVARRKAIGFDRLLVRASGLSPALCAPRSKRSTPARQRFDVTRLWVAARGDFLQHTQQAMVAWSVAFAGAPLQCRSTGEAAAGIGLANRALRRGVATGVAATARRLASVSTPATTSMPGPWASWITAHDGLVAGVALRVGHERLVDLAGVVIGQHFRCCRQNSQCRSRRQQSRRGRAASRTEDRRIAERDRFG